MFNCEENESMVRTDGMRDKDIWELQKKQTGHHASGWDFMQKISKKIYWHSNEGVMLG